MSRPTVGPGQGRRGPRLRRDPHDPGTGLSPVAASRPDRRRPRPRLPGYRRALGDRQLRIDIRRGGAPGRAADARQPDRQRRPIRRRGEASRNRRTGAGPALACRSFRPWPRARAADWPWPIERKAAWPPRSRCRPPRPPHGARRTRLARSPTPHAGPFHVAAREFHSSAFPRSGRCAGAAGTTFPVSITRTGWRLTAGGSAPTTPCLWPRASGPPARAACPPRNHRRLR